MPTSDVTFKYVSPDDLRFDPTNPRFASSALNKRQEQIQQMLENEPHLAKELVDSFLENGFIDYEPLTVREEGDHYVVVEGNRRLAAVRHILANRADCESRSKKIDDLLRIPVLVFPHTTEENVEKEQRVYLGVRHLFGFREWPAESKARFLDARIKNEADLQRTLRELNIKRSVIRRYLIPLRLRKEARDLWKPYQDQDFWVLGEALNRGGIKEYIGLDVDSKSLRIKEFDKKKLKNLLSYIYGIPEDGKRIRETRDVSLLGRVLESKAAAAELERGRSLLEASLFIESTEESVKRLKRLTSELRLLLKKVLAKQPKYRSAVDPVIKRFNLFDKAAKEFIAHAKKSNF